MIAVITTSFALFALAASAPQPAPWPGAFSVRFSEWITPFAPGPPPPASHGAWLYSYATKSWRAEHGTATEQQFNNFCACASNTTAACALIFTADGHMYADFPSAPDDCCRVCDAADGCSVLKPDWLSSASDRVYAGASVIDGRTCYEYCIPGADAIADCLLFEADQTPCRYSESFNFSGAVIVHNLTFTPGSFKVGPQPPSAFAVRPECSKACPRVFPTTCG